MRNSINKIETATEIVGRLVEQQAGAAFKEAQTEIVRAIAGKEAKLDLNDPRFHVLSQLPPEIARFGELETLNLSNTQIEDISVLSQLTRIQELSLHNTLVNDATALATCVKLKTLALSKTSVRDIVPLAQISTLELLDLSNSRVDDLTPVTQMKRLRLLKLSRTNVSDVAPIAGLKALEELYLSDTPIDDIAPLAEMTKLQWLSVSGTRVWDLRPLIGLLERLGDSPSNGVDFQNTPATHHDVELKRLSEIKDERIRTRETLAYLKSLPPLPEPLEYVSEHQASLLPKAAIAPLMVEMAEDNRLVAIPSPDHLDNAQRDLARDGWQALKDYLNHIIPVLGKLDNQMPMLSHALAALNRALGDEFVQVNQVSVGMQAHLVCELATISSNYLDPQDAIVMRAFSAQAQIYLARFSTWKSFEASVLPDDVIVQRVKQDASDFRALADGLDKEGLAGANILSPLHDIVSSGSAAEGTAIEALGVLTSFQNVQVTIFQTVMDASNALDKSSEEKEFWERVHGESKAKFADSLMDNITISGALVAVSYLIRQQGPLNRLAARYPNWFGFIGAALRQLFG